MSQPLRENLVDESKSAAQAFDSYVAEQGAGGESPLQAALGRKLAPAGSTREKMIRAMAMAKRISREEGFGAATKRAFKKIGRKLGVANQSAPAIEASAPTAAPTSSGDWRLDLVKRSLQHAAQSLAIADEYERAMNVAESSAQKPLPTYVPFDATPHDFSNPPANLYAFYLPQFHPFPENDKWWGKGFTEWTNVSKAVPQFPGHYQPHLPDELGFYDLRLPEIQERQVELAKHFGLQGFVFYYYWFGGKRLLDRPLDSFCENPKIDFPFCLMWANENWTRRWDGKEDDVLMAQDHSPEADVRFIEDALKYLRHPNYIKIDGRPVLMVYRHTLLPNVKATTDRWRETCKANGLPDPYLMAAQTFSWQDDPRELGFDAAIEFPPHNLYKECSCINYQGQGMIKPINDKFTGIIYSYPSIVGNRLYRPAKVPPYPLYETVMPMWDNTARRATASDSYVYGSPDLYKLWLQKLIMRAADNPHKPAKMVFINAWNEWAEGAHLEPDRRYGYGYLQATRDALLNVQAIRAQSMGQYANVKPIDYEKEALEEPPKSPILIYQMGKVASGTIYTVLKNANIDKPVLHCHLLHDLEEMEKRLVSALANPTSSLEHIAACKIFRDWMSTGDANTVWNVITLVREPVGRNVSDFFERADQFIPNLRARVAANDLTIEEVREVFLHCFRHDASLNWFDLQFEPVFHVDVLNEPFDPAKGYAIYEKLPSRVLVIRMKDLNSKLEQALEDFLGIKNAKPLKTNTAEDKDYIDLIQKFRRMPLPHEYVSSMLESKLATHFFSKEELADLYRRYTQEGLQ
jgi:hypothetical protein